MPQTVVSPTTLVPPARTGGAGNPPRLYVHSQATPSSNPQIREQIFTIPGGPSLAIPSWGYVAFAIQTAVGPYYLEPQNLMLSQQSVACSTKPFTIPRVLIVPRGGVILSVEFEWKLD